jgi:hypothetical protein
MRPGVKAGLVGGAALIVLDLIGLVPVIACIVVPLELLFFIGIGVLAAYWMRPRQGGGPAAGQGAIAGLIAGAIGGIASVALAPVSLAMSGGPEAILRQIPAESLQLLENAGINPSTLINWGTTAGLTAICCLPLGLLLGAGLGAVGALILGGTRSE